MDRRPSTLEDQKDLDIVGYYEIKDLGTTAVAKLIKGNPFFDKFYKGTLPNEDRQAIKGQLTLIQPQIHQLLASGIEASSQIPDRSFVEIISQICLNLGKSFDNNEAPPSMTQNATTVLQYDIDQIGTDSTGGRKNYLQIAGAVFALLRTTPFERMISRPKANFSKTRKEIQGLRSQISSVLPDFAKQPPSPSISQTLIDDERDESIEIYLTDRLIEVLRKAGKKNIQEDIFSGITMMSDAKQKFYQSLQAELDTK